MDRKAYRTIEIADSEGVRTFVVCGMPSVGKTTLVLNYIKKTYEEFLYIDARFDLAFRSFFSECAGRGDKLSLIDFFSEYFKISQEYLVNIPIILDEPSAALDASSREMFFALLGELNQKHGVTILLITHDTGEVGKYISKFMYIDHELVFFGDKEEFCHSPKVAEKLGAFAQHTIDHLHNHGHCPLGCRCESAAVKQLGHALEHGAEAQHD